MRDGDGVPIADRGRVNAAPTGEGSDASVAGHRICSGREVRQRWCGVGVPVLRGGRMKCSSDCLASASGAVVEERPKPLTRFYLTT